MTLPVPSTTKREGRRAITRDELGLHEDFFSTQRHSLVERQHCPHMIALPREDLLSFLGNSKLCHRSPLRTFRRRLAYLPHPFLSFRHPIHRCVRLCDVHDVAHFP